MSDAEYDPQELQRLRELCSKLDYRRSQLAAKRANGDPTFDRVEYNDVAGQWHEEMRALTVQVKLEQEWANQSPPDSDQVP